MNFSGLAVLGDDSGFFDELDTELRQHFVFGKVAERDDVAPIGSGGGQEEVAMERRYLGSPDLGTLESRLVYERSRGVPFGILEERSAGASGGLLGPAELAERRDVHRLEGVFGLAEGEVECGGNDETVGRILKRAGTVGETQLGVGEGFEPGFRDVPDVGGNEDVGGFESEAPRVPDDGSSERSGQSDPRNESGKPFRREKQGNGMDLFGRMGFEAAGSDSSRHEWRGLVLKMPEAHERILYEKPRKTVEREKAIGAVSEKRYRKSRFLCGSDGRRERRERRAVGHVQKVRRLRGRFESRKGGHVPFGLYGNGKNARHAAMVRGKRGKSRTAA